MIGKVMVRMRVGQWKIMLIGKKVMVRRSVTQPMNEKKEQRKGCNVEEKMKIELKNKGG